MARNPYCDAVRATHEAFGLSDADTVAQLHRAVEIDRDRTGAVVGDVALLEQVEQPLHDLRTGAAPDANSIPVPKENADLAMDAAACIGCGACVAACPNSAAQLFTAAKVEHLNLLPQGQAEKTRRTVRMVEQMDLEGFGACSNEGECEAVCPKEIPITNIARMNREYLKAMRVARRCGSTTRSSLQPGAPACAGEGASWRIVG